MCDQRWQISTSWGVWGANVAETYYIFCHAARQLKPQNVDHVWIVVSLVFWTIPYLFLSHPKFMVLSWHDVPAWAPLRDWWIQGKAVKTKSVHRLRTFPKYWAPLAVL